MLRTHTYLLVLLFIRTQASVNNLFTKQIFLPESIKVLSKYPEQYRK